MKTFIVSLNFLIWMADIGASIHRVTRTDEWTWLLSLIGSASVLCNLMSLTRIHETMDFKNRKLAFGICILMHIFQLGPLWRFIKICFVYFRQDNTDFMKLKLLYNSLASIGVVLTQSRILVIDLSDPWIAFPVVASFLSVLTTLTHFSTMNDVHSANFCLQTITTIAWRVCMLFSRFSIIIWISISELAHWIILVLGLHYLLILVILQTRINKGHWKHRLWLIILSLMNVAEITSEKPLQLDWILAFYSGTLCEMVAIVVTGEILLREMTLTHSLWLLAMLASFSLGLLLCLLSLKLSEGNSQTLRSVLQSCCPGQPDKDVTSLSWDGAYDVQEKKTSGHDNPAFQETKVSKLTYGSLYFGESVVTET